LGFGAETLEKMKKMVKRSFQHEYLVMMEEGGLRKW
jgi:hypothetical protein